MHRLYKKSRNLYVNFFGVIIYLLYFVDTEHQSRLMLMFLILIIFVLCACVRACRYVCVTHECLISVKVRSGSQVPETRVPESDESTFGCWKPDLGPLQRKQALSILNHHFSTLCFYHQIYSNCYIDKQDFSVIYICTYETICHTNKI